MRKRLVVIAVLTVSACNSVHSQKPLLADSADGPLLKPGLWVGVDKQCAFDTGLPLAQWPDCATALTIERGRIRAISEKKGEDVMSYRLGGRSPTVVQWRLGDPNGKAPIGDQPVALGDYQYLGLRVLASDAQDQVTEASYWTALCGAPPRTKLGQKPRYVSDAPLPGLTVVGDDCRADTLEAVRAAAAASQAWSPPGAIRWVRDRP